MYSDAVRVEVGEVATYPRAVERWPLDWSAIWVGTLAAIATALVFGLAGLALGSHQIGPAQRIVKWSDFGVAALILGVFGAFISFVVGGWVAGKLAGYLRAEPAMVHGAIAWLVAVPILLALAGLGAGHYFGGWYGGLIGMPAWATTANAPVDPNAAAATRNAALAAVTAMLLGLVGSVIGGWMASGEPMTLTHHRTRSVAAEPAAS